MFEELFSRRISYWKYIGNDTAYSFIEKIKKACDTFTWYIVYRINERAFGQIKQGFESILLKKLVVGSRYL